MTPTGTPPRPTRTYDNSRRRAQAEETRARIVEAGSELLRESSIRDWDHVTVRAVAERAGVHERTVYRHFGSDKALRDAVMEHTEAAAGVDLSTVRMDDLAGEAGRVLRFASNFAPNPDPEIDPTLHETDARRRESLLHAVSEGASDWSEEERVRAAAVVDLLWGLRSYERVRAAWGLDAEQAIDVIQWGVQLVVDAAGSPDREHPARS